MPRAPGWPSPAAPGPRRSALCAGSPTDHTGVGGGGLHILDSLLDSANGRQWQDTQRRGERDPTHFPFLSPQTSPCSDRGMVTPKYCVNSCGFSLALPCPCKPEPYCTLLGDRVRVGAGFLLGLDQRGFQEPRVGGANPVLGEPSCRPWVFTAHVLLVSESSSQRLAQGRCSVNVCGLELMAFVVNRGKSSQGRELLFLGPVCTCRCCGHHEDTSVSKWQETWRVLIQPCSLNLRVLLDPRKVPWGVGDLP